MNSILKALLVAALVSSQAEAQTRHGKRDVMPREAEVALARSAAPAAISTGARVWVWTGSSYAIADSGSTSVNCYVARLWVPSTEPHCFDAEASATVMPILMRQAELYAQGRTEEAVELEIARGIARGTLRLPRRPAVTYMMSEAQRLVSGDGTSVGAWQPHLMIYYPHWSGEQAGLPRFVGGVGFVENPGQALSALVIPLPSFVPAPKRP